MPPPVGALSVVAEVTRTAGTGPYLLQGGVARAGKFAQFYNVGDSFDYFVDNGGGTAEYGRGQLNADGTVSRLTIYWTTSAGVGGPPISWMGSGRRFIRAVLSSISASGGGGGTKSVGDFWNGTIAASAKIERFIFVEPTTFVAGLVGSYARCDRPPAGAGTPSRLVTETGNLLADQSGNHFITMLAGGFLVTETGNRIVTETGDALLLSSVGAGGGAPVILNILKNGIGFGTITFLPNITDGVLSSSANVSFVASDLLEIVGPPSSDPNLADLVWRLLGV